MKPRQAPLGVSNEHEFLPERQSLETVHEGFIVSTVGGEEDQGKQAYIELDHMALLVLWDTVIGHNGCHLGADGLVGDTCSDPFCGVGCQANGF